MVIPQLILPVAGNAPSAQGNGQAAGGQAAPAGGLFAALLAALAGALEGATEGSADAESGGENALLLTGEAEIAEGAEEAVDASEVLTPFVEATASTELKLVSAKAEAVPAQPNVVAAPSPESVKPASVPQSANNVPTVVGVPAAGDEPVAVGPPAPAEAKAALPAQAATPTPPAAEPALQTAPGLAEGKPPLLTVPAKQANAGGSSAATAKPELPRGVPFQPDAKAPPAEAPPLAADSKADQKPDVYGFEKAKPFADALKGSEEPIATPLRKAIEAFTKPATGQPESVVNAARPQTPAVAPALVIDNANAPVADVTRVTAAIAPAEAGSEAPKTGEVPAKPEGPVRTTLPELAHTAVRGIRYLAHNGEHRMSIRLIPESLGEVHIEVQSSKKALTVKLVADSALARETIEAHVHQLRDSLSQEGLEVRSITISDDSGSGRGAQNQREAFASRNGERGQSQSQNQSTPDQSSGRRNQYAAPRARHEGAFDRVA